MAGSPKCWLGPGWVWLGEILAAWPPATCLLPAIPSPVPATGSFTGSHPPATVAENWRMPAKLRLVASAPPADASHRSQRMSSLFPARSQRVRQSLSSALPAVYFYWGTKRFVETNNAILSVMLFVLLDYENERHSSTGTFDLR